MTPKRAKRRSEADFWAQISITFPREFRRPIKFALLRPAPIFVAEKDRPREDDLFDRSSQGATTMPTNFRPQIWFQVIISVIGS